MSTVARHVIAVVDDNPSILESLQDLLESAGYEARLHSAGNSLLASGVSDIDCLITDVGMLGMDGLGLRDRIKRLRPELPVFLISGRSDLTDGERGQTWFFCKPFNGPALLAAIAEVLDRPSS